MTKWQHKLYLGDFYHSDAMTIKDKGKELAKRLARIHLPPEFKDEQEDITYRFEHDVETGDDFDYIMDDLYDLGDTELPTQPGQMQRKLMWIDTLIETHDGVAQRSY